MIIKPSKINGIVEIEKGDKNSSLVYDMTQGVMLKMNELKIIDDQFLDRVKLNDGGFIVMRDDADNKLLEGFTSEYLHNIGIKAVVAKSFVKDYKDELIKNCIIPMVFVNEDDYNNVGLYDILKFNNLVEDFPKGIIEVINITKGKNFWVKVEK